MREKVIEMARNGEICKVYGHRWTDTTPNHILTSNPPRYPDRSRMCDFCKKEQIEKTTPPEWTDK